MSYFEWLLVVLFAVGFIVGATWPNQSRRIIFIVLLGAPMMLLGYLFGYVQAGFITGYRLYLSFDAAKAPRE